MKIFRKDKLLNDDTNKIIQSLEDEILNNMINKKNNICSIIKKDLKNKRLSRDLILQDMLNYYLNKITETSIKQYFQFVDNLHSTGQMPSVNNSKFMETRILIDDLIDEWDPAEKIWEDGMYIAQLLIHKKINTHGHDFPNEVTIPNIKFYSISYNMTSKEIDDEIMFIVFYIAIHYYTLRDLK